MAVLVWFVIPRVRRQGFSFDGDWFCITRVLSGTGPRPVYRTNALISTNGAQMNVVDGNPNRAIVVEMSVEHVPRHRNA